MAAAATTTIVDDSWLAAASNWIPSSPLDILPKFANDSIAYTYETAASYYNVLPFHAGIDATSDFYFLLAVLTISSVLWSLSTHYRLFVSLYCVLKRVPFMINNTFFDFLVRYQWYFLKARFMVRDDLVADVKNLLLDTLQVTNTGTGVSQNVANLRRKDADEFSSPDDENVIVAHSCRTIFYCVIKTLLDEAEERTGERRIRVCCAAYQFGGFHKLMKAIRESGSQIDILHIKVNRDFTLDLDSLDEDEVAKCDLILVQHFFGYPIPQAKLFDLAEKHNIPTVEDLVQSGSLYSRYCSHESLGIDHRPDVALWSSGMDKIPSSLGGGLGYFRRTAHGARLFAKANALHETFPIDSFNARLVAIVHQFIWKMITGWGFIVIPTFGFILYIVGIMKRGEYLRWYEVGLSVRSSKTVTPFAHEFRKFLRRPNRAHLLAMRNAMSPRWVRRYARIARHELSIREALLANIPRRCREKMFPWLTDEVLAAHLHNEGGIAEFTWICAPDGCQLEFLEHMNDWYILCVINTSWTYWEGGVPACRASKSSVDNSVIMTNFHNMNGKTVRYVARALTAWCEKKHPELCEA